MFITEFDRLTPSFRHQYKYCDMRTNLCFHHDAVNQFNSIGVTQLSNASLYIYTIILTLPTTSNRAKVQPNHNFSCRQSYFSILRQFNGVTHTHTFQFYCDDLTQNAKNRANRANRASTKRGRERKCKSAYVRKMSTVSASWCLCYAYKPIIIKAVKYSFSLSCAWESAVLCAEANQCKIFRQSTLLHLKYAWLENIKKMNAKSTKTHTHRHWDTMQSMDRIGWHTANVIKYI